MLFWVNRSPISSATLPLHSFPNSASKSPTFVFMVAISSSILWDSVVSSIVPIDKFLNWESPIFAISLNSISLISAFSILFFVFFQSPSKRERNFLQIVWFLSCSTKDVSCFESSLYKNTLNARLKISWSNFSGKLKRLTFR